MKEEKVPVRFLRSTLVRHGTHGVAGSYSAGEVAGFEPKLSEQLVRERRAEYLDGRAPPEPAPTTTEQLAGGTAQLERLERAAAPKQWPITPAQMDRAARRQV